MQYFSLKFPYFFAACPYFSGKSLWSFSRAEILEKAGKGKALQPLLVRNKLLDKSDKYS